MLPGRFVKIVKAVSAFSVTTDRGGEDDGSNGSAGGGGMCGDLLGHGLVP